MLLRNLFTKLSPRPRVSNTLKYVYLNCDASKCYYCSGIPSGMDHVLPQSIARLLPYFPFSPELLQLVPCCTRCNSVASNRFFITLAAKKKFINDRIYELHVRSTYAEVLSKLDKFLR